MQPIRILRTFQSHQLDYITAEHQRRVIYGLKNLSRTGEDLREVPVIILGNRMRTSEDIKRMNVTTR